MKDTTKAWWRQKWEHVKEFAIPFFCGATIGAAWFGYGNSIRNSWNIDKLQNQVDHNVGCSISDRRRIEELEKNRDLLMKKALNVTEGKEESAA